MRITEVEKAYLAGIIDGEGCIGLYRFNYKSRNLVYRPQIIIVNTNKKLIEAIENLYKRLGLKYYIQIKKSYNTKWKKPITIKVQNKKSSLVLLEQISNYLIIKKEQAEIVKVFCRKLNGTDYKDMEVNPETMYQEIKVLNKKGN